MSASTAPGGLRPQPCFFLIALAPIPESSLTRARWRRLLSSFPSTRNLPDGWCSWTVTQSSPRNGSRKCCPDDSSSSLSVSPVIGVPKDCHFYLHHKICQEDFFNGPMPAMISFMTMEFVRTVAPLMRQHFLSTQACALGRQHDVALGHVIWITNSTVLENRPQSRQTHGSGARAPSHRSC